MGATEGCVSLSLLYWLKMLGIFLAVLLTLALMTLVTCRRPRKRGDIEVRVMSALYNLVFTIIPSLRLHRSVPHLCLSQRRLLVMTP